MNALRTILRKAASVIFPWPAKHERQAAIAAAKREKQRAQAAKDKARTVERQIRQMAAENHFADLIAEQLMRRPGR